MVWHLRKSRVLADEHSDWHGGNREDRPAELKASFYTLLKCLKECSLDSLLEAVESHRGLPTDCVLVLCTDKACLAASPHLLSKLFHWPDVQHPADLKSLCKCCSFDLLPSAAHHVLQRSGQGRHLWL
ncbi:UNVERIFIED_CONTAM: Mothers against decapentaplegic 6 [Gekko kuhli]